MNGKEHLVKLLEVLAMPKITIKDLQTITGQSYEKSRQDFNRMKKEYENNMVHGKQLPNSREIPLNDYILKVLEEWYGVSKQSIIENINILNMYSNQKNILNC